MSKSPIVARINSLLAEKGISKQDFYESCHITSATYSLWNTGKTTPRMRNLEVIASFLQTTTDYLLTGLGPKAQPQPLPHPTERPDIAQEAERIMSDLASAGELNFDGLPISPEEREAMLSAMKLGLAAARAKRTKNGK